MRFFAYIVFGDRQGRANFDSEFILEVYIVVQDLFGELVPFNFFLDQIAVRSFFGLSICDVSEYAKKGVNIDSADFASKNL